MTSSLILGTGGLQIEIWPLGARLNGLKYKGIDCVVGSSRREEALDAKKFNGAVVGPVANRIAEGRFELDGTAYTLPLNENNETTLHGGPQGTHALDWTINEVSETAATLALSLSDGFGGFPGNRVLKAHYDVGEHEFSLTLEATSDAPTLINLALHPYWILDATDRDDLQISLNAATYTPIDKRKIPTGQIKDVSDSIYDLRQMACASPEIDHNFCLPKTDETVLTLCGKQLRMELSTDAPGMQLYTGKTTGIAIEPQHWPDAIHHDNFPSIVLRPGETYRQTSTYRFSRL